MKILIVIILTLISFNLLSQNVHYFYEHELYLSDYLSPQNSPDKNDSILNSLFSTNKYDLMYVTDSFAIKYIRWPKYLYIFFYPNGQFKVTDSIIYDNSYINAGPYKIHDVYDSIIFININYVKKYPQWFGATDNPADSILNDMAQKKLERLLPSKPSSENKIHSTKMYHSFIFDNYNTYYYCFGSDEIRGKLPRASDTLYTNITYKVYNYGQTDLLIWVQSGDKINGAEDAIFYVRKRNAVTIINTGFPEIGWQVGDAWFER